MCDNIDDKVLEKTSQNYAKLLDVDLENKLRPLHQSIDVMLSRLEEYQTMISFIRQERVTSQETFDSLTQFNQEVNALYSRIEGVETLIAHIKGNLNYLENNLEKAEQKLGVADNKSKVTNIFMPFFKKTGDKSSTPQNPVLFKTEDYFDPSTS